MHQTRIILQQDCRIPVKIAITLQHLISRHLTTQRQDLLSPVHMFLWLVHHVIKELLQALHRIAIHATVRIMQTRPTQIIQRRISPMIVPSVIQQQAGEMQTLITVQLVLH